MKVKIMTLWTNEFAMENFSFSSKSALRYELSGTGIHDLNIKKSGSSGCQHSQAGGIR
jgi:hypothetical protein